MFLNRFFPPPELTVTYKMILTHKPWQWLETDTNSHELEDPSTERYRELKRELEEYVR